MGNVGSERELRRTQILELQARGFSQDKIATIVGVGQQYVSAELKAMATSAENQTAFNMDEYRLDTMVKTEIIILEAMDSWRKSKDKYTETITQLIYDGDKAVKKERKVKKGNGDPRYLEAINKAMERRSKILGLDAPQKVETSVTIISSKPARGVNEDDL